MNTENLSPGVYVPDVKPLGRPLTTPSLSTFAMFGRLSVKGAMNAVVAVDSFPEYLQRHLATNRGPFGSALMLRLALELPWVTNPTPGAWTCQNAGRLLGERAHGLGKSPARLGQYGVPSPPQAGGAAPAAGGGAAVMTLHDLHDLFLKVEDAQPAQRVGILQNGTNPALEIQNGADPTAPLAAIARTALYAYYYFQNGGKRLVLIDADPETVTPDDLAKIYSSLYLQDVGLLATPGSTSPAVVRDYCGRRDDTHPDGDPFCFGLLDLNDDGMGNGLTEPADEPADESVGYYSPYVEVEWGGQEKRRLLLPPSPFVAGVIARTDSQFGPHYAPAGTDRPVIGAVRDGLAYRYTDSAAGRLNTKGVNCLRAFPGDPSPVVFGCRTHAKDPRYKHVPVVRLLSMIRKAVKKQLKYVVHKPNTRELRQALVRDLYTFLEARRREGMLDGATAKDAFNIQCDEQNNTPDSIREGKLNIRVAVKPVFPAEFVIVEVTQLQER
jgi:hypothetical protein